MIKIPPYLKIGNTVGIICPSGFMPLEKTNECVNTLKQWGYNVKVGKTVGAQHHYFSGTDEERLADLQMMMDDENIHAILCARGGYGMGRIVEQLNFKKFLKKPKWIIGFSDITVLHSHLYSRYRMASMHAPMANAFNEKDNIEYLNSLKNSLKGDKANYTCNAQPFSRDGKCRGRLVGGNLSILTHLIGTSSDVNTKNKILFLEDVGEYIYNIDRMMYQLKRAGKLKHLAGLIVGGFTEIKDTAVSYGMTAEACIADIIKEYKFPIAFGFPVSHAKENFALKVGIKYELINSGNLTSLIEI